MLARLRTRFSTPSVFLLMAFSLCLGTSQPSVTWGDELDGLVKVRTEVTVSGSGPAARARALQQAEQDALKLFIESTLNDDDLDTMDRIFHRAWRYIRTSRIVDYTRVPEGTKISAEVYLLTERLRRDIAGLLLPNFASSPRAIILFSHEVSDRNAVSTAQPGEAEKVFRELFERSGFDIFNAHELRRRYTNRELLDRIFSEDALVAKFGRENNVDVVVLGEALITGYRPEESLNIIRVTAKVRGRVIRSSDATLLDHFETESVVTALTLNSAARQAIQDSCEKVLRNALAGATLGVAHQGTLTDIHLTLDMPETWQGKREVVAVLRTLSGVTGVEELKPLDGAYRFRIAYEGAMKDFVHDLTDRDYSDFRLEPARVIGYEVSLRIQNW